MTCKKRSFESEALAIQGNQKASFRIRAYLCHCSKWHITNADKKDQNRPPLKQSRQRRERQKSLKRPEVTDPEVVAELFRHRRPKKLSPEDLLCQACGQACPCDLYQHKEPHAHCPGGLDDYLLCEECEKKCLAIHRPVSPDGTWKWIEDCGQDCGYCQALAKLRR